MGSQVKGAVCGIVAAVGKNLSPALPDVEVVDGSGLTALPGLVDQHVHFTGGGGECGFRSRVPELSLTDFTTAGVTTAVGLLGTDSATRSPKSLLANREAASLTLDELKALIAEQQTADGAAAPKRTARRTASSRTVSATKSATKTAAKSNTTKTKKATAKTESTAKSSGKSTAKK